MLAPLLSLSFLLLLSDPALAGPPSREDDAPISTCVWTCGASHTSDIFAKVTCAELVANPALTTCIDACPERDIRDYAAYNSLDAACVAQVFPNQGASDQTGKGQTTILGPLDVTVTTSGDNGQKTPTSDDHGNHGGDGGHGRDDSTSCAATGNGCMLMTASDDSGNGSGPRTSIMTVSDGVVVTISSATVNSIPTGAVISITTASVTTPVAGGNSSNSATTSSTGAPQGSTNNAAAGLGAPGVAGLVAVGVVGCGLLGLL